MESASGLLKTTRCVRQMTERGVAGRGRGTVEEGTWFHSNFYSTYGLRKPANSRLKVKEAGTCSYRANARCARNYEDVIYAMYGETSIVITELSRKSANCLKQSQRIHTHSSHRRGERQAEEGEGESLAHSPSRPLALSPSHPLSSSVRHSLILYL